MPKIFFVSDPTEGSPLPFSLNLGQTTPQSAPVSTSQGTAEVMDLVVIERVRDLISYAATEGGLYNETMILQAKRDIEAFKMGDRLVRGEHKLARAHNDRGLASMRNGQFAEAVRAFEAAFQVDPADVVIVDNLGGAYLRSGDLSKAEQVLLKALALAPDRANAWATLGQAFAKQGKLSASVACFAHAYRFSRNQDTTRRFLQGLTEQEDG